VCSGWLLGDGPDGVDDAGEVAEEGEDEADPELNLQPYQPTVEIYRSATTQQR
jgi:hypothetical protein